MPYMLLKVTWIWPGLKDPSRTDQAGMFPAERAWSMNMITSAAWTALLVNDNFFNPFIQIRQFFLVFVMCIHIPLSHLLQEHMWKRPVLLLQEKECVSRASLTDTLSMTMDCGSVYYAPSAVQVIRLFGTFNIVPYCQVCFVQILVTENL